MSNPTASLLRTLLAPLGDPADLVALLGPDEPGVLLDSGMDPGRWSAFVRHPAALLAGTRRGGEAPDAMDLLLVTWTRPDGTRPAAAEMRRFTGDPFAALRDLQTAYPAAPERREAPAPFAGGLVGWFGYETAHVLEALPDTGADDLGLPDLIFLVADEVLVHDRTTGEATLHVTGRGPAAAAGAAARTAAWQDEVTGAEPLRPTVWPAGAALPGAAKGPAPTTFALPDAPDVRSHFTREAYLAAVARCREHILAGDVFEVCLTHRLEMDLPGEPRDLHRALRGVNPAPFASYLQLPGFAVVGASPERFLRLEPDGLAESRPIKGTRPRAADPDRDAAVRAELAAAEKDLAENIMIVDLVRNDLGRVCRIGSVHVPELQAVESYATVHQLVSTVRGVLKPDRDALDLVRACFPGGSMTGAPKIEAMKIIDTLEPVARGVYSGALGYLDAGGAMDLGMVIRTIVCRDGRATFGVGGAVTADSDPAAEWDETLDKARALIAAVRQVAAGGSP